MSADDQRRHDEPAPRDFDVDAYDEERAKEVAERERRYYELLRRLSDKDRQEGEKGNEGDIRVPPVTPYLLLRYAPTDVGARPVPYGTPFWISPDIWVDSSDPAGNPVAGEENTVMARIFNLGAFQATPVQVDFFWGDPSLGLNPGTMHLIGTAWTDVPSLTSVVVPCPTPWIPTVVNNGHECVIVNVSSWLADPIIAPFNAVADRHVGQRNLHVVQPAMAAKSPFMLKVTNPFEKPMTARILLTTHRVKLRRGKLDDLAHAAIAFVDAARAQPQALLALHPEGTPGHEIAEAAVRRARRHPAKAEPAFVRVPDEGLDASVTVSFTGDVERHEDPRDAAFASSLLAQRLPQGQTRGHAVAEAELDAHTVATLEVRLEAPADLGPDEVVVIHLEQHLDDAVVTGGYTVAIAHASQQEPAEQRGFTVETPARQDDLLELIVAEVDEARDIHQLARQLAKFLPIKSFDHLVEAAGERELTFRDTRFGVDSLRGALPDILFPVDDLSDLVRRLGSLVRAVPASLALDPDSAETGRRISRRLSESALRPDGGRPNAVAMASPFRPGDEGLTPSATPLSE